MFHLFIFAFISFTLVNRSKINSCGLCQRVFYLFSSRNFIVFSLTFRTLIHFEFIFAYSIRECSNFILLHVKAVQSSQNHLLKRHCLFFNVCLCHSRGIKQTFFQRRYKMANRYMKRCWTISIIREMQTKTKMRYHLTPVRMARVKKKHAKIWWGCGEKVIVMYCGRK